MSIKPVLVPDHDAAALRGLMDRFADASTGPTRQQLAESRAAVTAARKTITEGSISDLLNQDPTSPKFNDHPGASRLKKAEGDPKPVTTGHFADKKYTDKGLPKPYPKLKNTSTGKVRHHPNDPDQGVAEGFMDTVKQAFNDAVVGHPMGTSDEQFIKSWADDIRDRTGRDIPVEKLAKLYQDYTRRSDKIMQSHGTTNEESAERLSEFAPSDSGDGGGDDDGFDEDTLRKLAAQWFNGDEDPQVERLLAAAGWEIGQDEGYDDEPGVFVVLSGDDNGRSYISWPAEELRSDVAEARPDVMRHGGDKTIRVVKKGGKPIGEIGTDSEASPGNGPYYVKLYDGSYDAVGFDTAEEALAELKYAVKQMAEGEIDEGWKQKVAGAALAGAAALGAGGAQAQATDKYDPDWNAHSMTHHIRSDVSSTKGINSADPSQNVNDFQKRIQKVSGPNAKGEYKVVVMQGNDIVSHYVTKTPPANWLYKEGVTEAGAENNPVVNAITRRIMLQRTDLLSKYGPEKIGQAVDEVADFVGDVEEIGSSDVSGWVRHVEQMLGNMESGVTEQQVDELSPKTLGSYIKKSSADAATRQGEVSGRNQFGKGAEFAVKAFYGDRIQPHPQRNDTRIAKRQAGVDRAVDRLTKEDMAESQDPVEQLRADIRRFAR